MIAGGNYMRIFRVAVGVGYFFEPLDILFETGKKVPDSD
jgi:hypothetical protein